MRKISTLATISIIASLLFLLPICADDICINAKDGREIVLHDDGTWELVVKQEGDGKSDSKPDFRKVNWGMSNEEVKRIEKAKLLQEDENSLAYEDKLSGFDVYLHYIFADQKLVRAMYTINAHHTNETDHIADYKRLKELLIKKYGTPIDDHIVWKNDLYKDNTQAWGLAISMGYLYYFSAWELWSTNVVLSLSGDNYEIRHLVEYRSKEFAEIEDKKNETQALDDL